MSGLQESIALIDFEEVNLNAQFVYPFYVFPSLVTKNALNNCYFVRTAINYKINTFRRRSHVSDSVQFNGAYLNVM